MSTLTEDERDALRDWWDEETTVSVESAFPIIARIIAAREGVGTGAGEGATGQDTGTAWVTRSTDRPEAPAQAHPLADQPGCLGRGYLVAPDASGVPTIWRTDELFPEAVITQHPFRDDPELWKALVQAVERGQA